MSLKLALMILWAVICLGLIRFTVAIGTSMCQDFQFHPTFVTILTLVLVLFIGLVGCGGLIILYLLNGND